MKFLSTTAKLAGGLAAAFLMSTAIANAAPVNTHDTGPRIERHDTRGAPAKPQFDGRKGTRRDGRKFARVERHDWKGHCGRAHRHFRHERHAHEGWHGHHRMAWAGKHRDHGRDRFNHNRFDRDHDRRG